MFKFYIAAFLATAIGSLLMASPPISAAEQFCGVGSFDDVTNKSHRGVRFATFNASMNRSNEGDLIANLSNMDDANAQAVAEIIQRVRPDVLLINEFDFDSGGVAAELFQDNYLSESQNGAKPIHYSHRFIAPSNTGIPSGLDLDNDGSVGGPGDAYGFGFFPGQFGMLVLSRYPILDQRARTFQKFLWADMPGALLPDNPATPTEDDWFSQKELAAFRLSSKNHWDIPVLINGRAVHVLASHPTPPVFDGEEDRNGTRNHDEIRFWADYVGGRSRSAYIYDDEGRRGGLARQAAFVIMGDLNADPYDGDSTNNAVNQVLQHREINASVIPSSLGAIEAGRVQAGLNLEHQAPHLFDTGDFNDAGPGNLRVDYVLPSYRGLKTRCGGVYWPRSDEDQFALVGNFPFPSSDHRLVWMDLDVKRGHRF